MARISRILLSVMALLGVAILSTPGTASAAQDYPTAYNTKTQYLKAQPTSDMPKSCVERHITLLGGDYDWGQILGAGDRPNLYLGAGAYTWEDCLYPDDDFYIHQTKLNPDNPDWDEISLTESVFLADSDSYTWGSYLDPRF
ncbi:hypothetical protein ACWY4P_00900 [Streptomyces sp. LZ34]